MLDPAFVKPTYDSYCFTAVPTSIAGLLGAADGIALPQALGVGSRLPARYRAVITVLADGFGWRFFEKFASDYPVLRRFTDAGSALKIRSEFPSTTAAHVTTLHTGQEVGQTGVYEWQYYEPQLDAVITPLLFSFAGTIERDQLKPTGISPEKLYPTRTLYHVLAETGGVRSFAFQHRDLTPSAYSNAMFAGAQVVPYKTLPEGLVNLRILLDEQRGPAYFVLYTGALDSIAHEYGPNSPQLEAEFHAFFSILERALSQGGRRGDPDVLLLLTADHGMVEVDPGTTVYLNTRQDFTGIQRFLRADRRGRTLVPGGSARDLFLYIKPGMVDEAQAFLAQRLEGRAVVYRVADLIADGFFGAQPPSDAFMGRVGDLVILPYRGESVWWYEKDRFEMKFRGHHGGLTPQEMEIPLLAYAF